MFYTQNFLAQTLIGPHHCELTLLAKYVNTYKEFDSNVLCFVAHNVRKIEIQLKQGQHAEQGEHKHLTTMYRYKYRL